jgi:hypothetical protein
MMINESEKEGEDNGRVSITTSLLVVNGSWKLLTELQQNKLPFSGTTGPQKTFWLCFWCHLLFFCKAVVDLSMQEACGSIIV